MILFHCPCEIHCPNLPWPSRFTISTALRTFFVCIVFGLFAHGNSGEANWHIVVVVPTKQESRNTISLYVICPLKPPNSAFCHAGGRNLALVNLFRSERRNKKHKIYVNVNVQESLHKNWCWMEFSAINNLPNSENCLNDLFQAIQTLRSSLAILSLLVCCFN